MIFKSNSKEVKIIIVSFFYIDGLQQTELKSPAFINILTYEIHKTLKAAN